VDLRYLYLFVFSFVNDKGYIRDIKSGSTFLLHVSILLYHHFNSHGDIAFFAYKVSPHGYHTIGVTSMFNLLYI